MTENKKAKIGPDIFFIIGIIFFVMGAAYIGIGISTFFWSTGEGTALFRYIFGGVGLVLFVIGIVCLWSSIQKRKRMNHVLSAGKYVMADITGIDQYYNIRINGRHPYIVTCQYQDISGNVHIFRSRYLKYDPSPFLQNPMVRVYVDAENYKYYYVDIDEVLPNVIEH